MDPITVGGALVKGLQLGLHAMAAWQEYNQALLDRQQQRAAEGKELTQADVAEELAKTHAKIDANKVKIDAAAAAKAAS